jgi:hypothetical protein
MKLESKRKCSLLEGAEILIVNVVSFTVNEFVNESRSDFIASTKLQYSPATCMMETCALSQV